MIEDPASPAFVHIRFPRLIESNARKVNAITRSERTGPLRRRDVKPSRAFVPNVLGRRRRNPSFPALTIEVNRCAIREQTIEHKSTRSTVIKQSMFVAACCRRDWQLGGCGQFFESKIFAERRFRKRRLNAKLHAKRPRGDVVRRLRRSLRR